MNIKVKLCGCSWPNIILSIINLSPKCQRSFHSLGHTKINICRRVVPDPELCLDRPSDLRRQKWPGPTPQSQWGSYAPICHLSPAVSAPPPRPMAVRPNCNRCSGPGQHGPFASFRPKKWVALTAQSIHCRYVHPKPPLLVNARIQKAPAKLGGFQCKRRPIL